MKAKHSMKKQGKGGVGVPNVSINGLNMMGDTRKADSLKRVSGKEHKAKKVK